MIESVVGSVLWWAVVVSILAVVTVCILWTVIYCRYSNDSHCKYCCHCRYSRASYSSYCRSCHCRFSRDCDLVFKRLYVFQGL